MHVVAMKRALAKSEPYPPSLAVLEAVLLLMISKSLVDAEEVADALEDAAMAIADDAGNIDAQRVQRIVRSIRAVKRQPASAFCDA